MELSDYRNQIDHIDKELIRLFAERMDVAAEIAAYKKEHGLAVLDPARERAKLLDVAEQTPEALQEYAVSLYSLLFELSRSYQNRLLEKPSALTQEIQAAIEQTPKLFPQRAAVACQGVEGAFSQIAAERIFHDAMVRAGERAVFQFVRGCVLGHRGGTLPIRRGAGGEQHGWLGQRGL